MNALDKRLSKKKELIAKVMHKLVLLLSLVWCGTAMSQTNQPVFPAMPFSTPSFRLRESGLATVQLKLDQDVSPDSLSDSASQGLTPVSPTNTIESLNLSAASSGGMTRFEREAFDRLVRGGYLNAPKPPTDNRLERLLNSTFEPEVLHFHKVSVSCSAITAIKRKNPLCLI